MNVRGVECIPPGGVTPVECDELCNVVTALLQVAEVHCFRGIEFSNFWNETLQLLM